MAVFVSAAQTLRKKLIVDGLRECGAFSPETAKTLEEAGVPNPDDFREYTELLADRGIIYKTPGGKYYVNRQEDSYV